MQELYKQYAELVADRKVLDAQIKNIGDKILDKLSDTERTEYGTFTRSIYTKWEYSQSLKDKLEDVKIAQHREQEMGVAEATQSASLRFTPKKK